MLRPALLALLLLLLLLLLPQLLASVPAAGTTFGGGYLNQISTVFSPPFAGCPICATTNTLTGNCSCPVGSELVQPIAAISDCAAGPELADRVRLWVHRRLRRGVHPRGHQWESLKQGITNNNK